MDRLPVEIWIKITSFACTDGGYAGRSLSLVCYLMREITLPSRYHSVALVGFKSYLAFVDLLDRLDVQPTIHHLFFSFPPHLRVAEQHLLYRLSEGYLLNSFRKILTIASPTLQTMFAPTFPNIKTAWPILPILTDLTLYGLVPPFPKLR